MTARMLLALATCCIAMAAHAAAPQPKIEVKVIGKQPAIVGESLQVQVTILAPNFFTSAPTFPVLQAQGAVITMPDERGVNSTEAIDGTSYAGIRKTYVFTAQSAGDFTLSAPDIAFRFAGDDGKPQEASVTWPPTVVHVGGQQSTAATRTPNSPGTPGTPSSPNISTLPAVHLEISQQLDRTANLKAGDALVRTLTIVAPGTPAMMIAPPALPAVRGVKQYRTDPLLADDAAGGRRTETVTYVFEGSGRYQLPAIAVAWYDASSGKAMQSSVPAVTVEVGRAGPAAGPRPSGATLARIARWIDRIDWLVVAGIAAVLALVALAAYTRYRWRERDPVRWQALRHRLMLRRTRGRLPPLNP